MNGVPVACFDEFFELSHHGDRIGERPSFPVIRVCFWRVYIGVQCTRCKKSYEVSALSECVRSAVKPFDNAKKFTVWLQVPREETTSSLDYWKLERVVVHGLCRIFSAALRENHSAHSHRVSSVAEPFRVAGMLQICGQCPSVHRLTAVSRRDTSLQASVAWVYGLF